MIKYAILLQLRRWGSRHSVEGFIIFSSEQKITNEQKDEEKHASPH